MAEKPCRHCGRPWGEHRRLDERCPGPGEMPADAGGVAAFWAARSTSFEPAPADTAHVYYLGTGNALQPAGWYWDTEDHDGSAGPFLDVVRAVLDLNGARPAVTRAVLTPAAVRVYFEARPGSLPNQAYVPSDPVKGAVEELRPRTGAGPAPDLVNHPPHYAAVGTCRHCGGDIEAIDVTERLDFCRGNAVKYLLRAGRKGDAEEQDLRKAEWYARRAVERVERGAGK